MVRELGEELNIAETDSRNVHYLGNLRLDYTTLANETNRKKLKCFISLYALKMRDISGIKVDHREAADIGWLSLEDTIAFISNNMTRIPYEESMAKSYQEIFENLKNYLYPELGNQEVKEENK